MYITPTEISTPWYAFYVEQIEALDQAEDLYKEAQNLDEIEAALILMATAAGRLLFLSGWETEDVYEIETYSEDDLFDTLELIFTVPCAETAENSLCVLLSLIENLAYEQGIDFQSKFKEYHARKDNTST